MVVVMVVVVVRWCGGGVVVGNTTGQGGFTSWSRQRTRPVLSQPSGPGPGLEQGPQPEQGLGPPGLIWCVVFRNVVHAGMFGLVIVLSSLLCGLQLVTALYFCLECVLWCIVMYCGVLWCIVVYCDVLWCIVVYCDVMWCIVMYCGVL